MALWSKKESKKNNSEEKKDNPAMVIAGTLMALFGTSELVGALATAQNVQTDGVGVFLLVGGTTLVAAQYLLKPILRK